MLISDGIISTVKFMEVLFQRKTQESGVGRARTERAIFGTMFNAVIALNEF